MQQHAGDAQRGRGEAAVRCRAAIGDPGGDRAGPQHGARHPGQRGERQRRGKRHRGRDDLLDAAALRVRHVPPHDVHRAQGHGQHGHAQGRSDDQRRIGAQVHREAGDQAQGRPQHDHQRERACVGAALARPQPVHAGGLDGPRRSRPDALQRERDGERAEDRADDHVGLAEQRIARVPAAHQRAAQQDVEQRKRAGRPGRAPRHVAHQQVLQRERRQRHAEGQRAVDTADLTQRMAGAGGERLLGRRRVPRGQRAAREQHAGDGEQQEEQQQEGLHAGEVVCRVVLVCPGPGQRGRGHGADQVQRAPGLEPGHRQDAHVEQRHVGHQRHIRTAAAAHQHRRCEAFGDGDEGQPERVLPDGQQRAEDRDQRHEREGQVRRQQRVQAQRAQRRQVEHADAGALQDQAVAGATGGVAAVAQAPA